ncbi:MAG: hypothetical protein IT195_10285 [Microthrixaceae bacterium]|nr:hypothetical protein [Microthrixaceae bacterium]
MTHTFDTDTFYLLVAHIEAEENELFPSAVCAFDDGGWDALEMAHRAVVEDAAG